MSDLEDMISSLERLDGLTARTAEIAAKDLETAVKRSAAAGTSPSGAAWAPRKDGGRPMANAAAHVSAKAFGPVIRMTLTGPDVFWHFGQRGAPPRPVIPDAGAGIPPEATAIVTEAGKKAWDEIIGGRGR